MNISFVFPQSLGKARAFLVNEVLSAAAKQQGHQVVNAEQADLSCYLTMKFRLLLPANKVR
ncbi:phosphotransferase system, fructose-specific IIC component [Actinobacillus equuli]|nr:phosphotransferase system, fructose-specific IIC component [Actinobacillus equuli]